MGKCTFKGLVATFCLLAASHSTDQVEIKDESSAIITAFTNQPLTVDEHGETTYYYQYETSNDIKVKERGLIRNPGLENQYHEVMGMYSYVAPDGTLFEVSYTAGPLGFIPHWKRIPAFQSNLIAGGYAGGFSQVLASLKGTSNIG